MVRFTPEFLDELRARVRVSDVVGRHVKLQKRGNAYWGLSPFKKEKTPSFTVDDNRQSYHCFSTGQHGDIIKFLMETKGLTFPEAVEQLASEAGMEIPKSSPEAAEQAELRKGLIEASEAAAVFFQSMLRRAPGRQATDYLKGRKVSEEQIEQFRLGYAPGDRMSLKDYLVNKGFTEATLVEAGLIIKPDDGGPGYDRFRNRVMFPIEGPRGAVIAFGGRALDADARAKYLNSPETPLFHKGDVLYNFNAARAAAADTKKPLIVCEGYMDVIALWGAGFKTAVAPLGTALTENQIALLWRQSDEPVLCFDGDSAGLSAAYRSIDRALPMLKPGKSINFAFAPEGQDPDDLIRSGGAPAFQSLLDETQSLADVLWRREIEAGELSTPERRAALRARLRDLIKGIADKDVRQAYGVEIANRLRDLFTPVAAPSGGSPVPRTSAGFARRRRYQNESERLRCEAQRTEALKQLGPPDLFARGASLIIAGIYYPELIRRREEDFFGLELDNADLDQLLGEVLGAILANPGLDSESLKAHLRQTPSAENLQRIVQKGPLNRQKFLRLGEKLDEVEKGWETALNLHRARKANAEVSESLDRDETSHADGRRSTIEARNEFLAQAKLGDLYADEGEVSSDELLRRLERTKSSVSAKRGGKPNH